MDAAVAALIGAGIGAVVPLVDGIRRDRRDDRRDKAARNKAEADRLFDHRTSAVLEFVTTANAAIHGPREDITRDDDPAFAAVARAYSLVGLSVTRGTWNLAKFTLDAIESYIFGAGDRREAEDQLQTFVVAAQDELGFTRPSTHMGAYSTRVSPIDDSERRSPS